jgi:hypothetical protein
VLSKTYLTEPISITRQRDRISLRLDYDY